MGLPQGTRVPGHGGFDITYLGWNTGPDILVAIKERPPADPAMREQDMSAHSRAVRGQHPNMAPSLE